MSGGVDEEKRNVDTHEAVRDGESEVMSESAKSQHELEAGIYKVKVKTEGDELMLSVSRNNKKAEEEADRKAKEEADRKAKEEADRKAKEEADRKAKEEADRKAKEEADRKAKEEADRKAKEEADRKTKEEARKQAEAAAITTTAVTTATETQPVASQATETQPAVSQATETQPAALQATETQPAASQATETQPAASQATETQPAASQVTETQPAASQSAETQPTASQAAETETPLPETTEGKYSEMLSLMQGLSTELQSVQKGPIVLTGKQMKDLHRITLLRAPFFGAPITNEEAEEAGREDLTTGEDLKNPKTLRKATKKLKKATKKEKKYKEALDEYIEARAEYINAKNATNCSLHITSALSALNERLECGEYIDRTYALLPSVSPLVLNLCTKKNQKALESGNCIQIMNNGKSVDVFPQSAVDSAGRAGGYLASCGKGYSNIFEKFLVENTKMTQSQAKSMVNTAVIAGTLLAGYFLFTKKEGDSRKFSFPSLKTLFGLAAVPVVGNWVSQAFTGNSLLDNFSRLWRRGELPWSSSDNLEAHEQGASQLAMGQFVLLGVPKRVLKDCATYNSSNKLIKIDLGGLLKYFGEAEANPNISSDDRARYGMQKIAIEKIKNDDGASIALNNYIAGLGISKGDLDGEGNIDDRLSDSRAKYERMLDYISARGFLIDPSKKEKVMDALTKEKEVDDKLFDKLKEEGCFTLDPKDSRYEELIKLNVSNEKKIRFYEAYKKLCDEGTEYGNIKLEVVDGKIQITSGSKSSTDQHKILLNPDNKIDNLVNAGGVNIEFKTEEELIRMGLFINYLRSTWWNEPTDAGHQKNPFVLDSPAKLWDDIKFVGPGDKKKTVLSSAVPFFSEMARKFPTIEDGNKREFLVDYLNKLWAQEHPTL